MIITPADRISQVQEYYFSQKLKEIKQLIEQGKQIINLGIGSPDLPPSDACISALTEAAQKPENHAYQAYVGIPELRTAFADWYAKHYGVTLDSESEVLPLIGSKEGIMHISMAFLNKGDQVLVPNPGYPTYSAVTKLVEAEAITYELKPENNWQPDFEELEKLDLSKVKIMWVNYPNMPTGAAASLQLFEKLIAFAKKHQILIVNDNPYSFILNEKPQTILSIKGAKDVALELNSLSKSHNMAGWRVGSVVGREDYLQAILRVKSNVDTGSFKPVQLAAVKALEASSAWYTELNKEYASRRELVYELFDLLDCSYQREAVGMFVWAKIPNHYQDAAELADKFLYQAEVFITPGFIFGSAGARYLRVSLCSPKATIARALARIKEVVKK